MVAWLRSQSDAPARPAVEEIIDLARRYFLQETLGPLRRIGRTLAFGVAGALAYCIGALVVLIAESAQTSNPGASLLDYLETVAITGRLAFFSRQLGIDDRATPTRNQWELEDMICGLSN